MSWLWLTVKGEDWNDSQTLQQYIYSCFPPSMTKASKKQSFPFDFNALNLQEIGGLQIVWTNWEHLSLDHTETVLYLFDQGQFLQNYQNSGER